MIPSYHIRHLAVLDRYGVQHAQNGSVVIPILSAVKIRKKIVRPVRAKGLLILAWVC